MEKQYPKVSVMIPTYNQENYIAQAIESVLMQDYENLEIIISDDCSTDKTGEIAQKYASDSRVRYIRNPRNLGRVGNYRNTLLRHTTGEWVVNLDGDDYYTDNTFISRAICSILSQKNVVCLFGNKHFPHKLQKYVEYKISETSYLLPGKFYLKQFSRIGAFSHLTTLYKRDVAIADGLCYTYEGLQADFHGIVRLSVYGNVILAKENGYHWRVHTDNATRSLSPIRIYIQGRRCQYKIMHDIGTHFSDQEKRQWLEDTKVNVKRRYILDNLVFNHSLYSIKIGILNFRFDKVFIIIYIKAVLATLFKINLF